jgi:hypothetical protein
MTRIYESRKTIVERGEVEGDEIECINNLPRDGLRM